ncbi:MAG: hypothetical protein IH802_05970, partial [Nitrospinae bacterium]|nr:hypothetical protein [Nitrospinota bacterium]
MTHRHIIRSLVWLTVLGLAILLNPQTSVESREAFTQVENYRLGSHRGFTRILIQLNQDSKYRLITSAADAKAVLWIRNATLNPRVQSNAFRDSRLAEIQVEEIQKNVKFTFWLKGRDTRLVHFMQHQPAQIVIDLKSKGAVSKQVARKKKQPTVKAAAPAARLTQKQFRKFRALDP